MGLLGDGGGEEVPESALPLLLLPLHGVADNLHSEEVGLALLLLLVLRLLFEERLGNGVLELGRGRGAGRGLESSETGDLARDPQAVGLLRLRARRCQTRKRLLPGLQLPFPFFPVHHLRERLLRDLPRALVPVPLCMRLHVNTSLPPPPLPPTTPAEQGSPRTNSG